jgi:cobalt-zinc-cadmium resistance protein CzcA
MLVSSALGGVGRAVLLGAFFVIVVLFALLGDLRAALLVTFTIPLSVALAGIFLHQAGVGINTMTLGGVAIAVGLLVDASIIMVENIIHRLSLASADSRTQHALTAAVEVGRPIAFATLIVMAVFLPLFGMSGIEGRMYRPLAAAVVATVGASLILAITAASRRSMRRYSTSACGGRVWSNSSPSPSRFLRSCSPSSSAVTSCRGWTRARS